MKKNLTQFIFMLILIISGLISISSSNWFSAWIGLEINLISFVTFIYKSDSFYFSESMIKYFIIQSMGSMLFFMGIIFLMSLVKFLNIVMLCSLLIKLGMAPFHTWVPSLMEGMSWADSIIFLTWQSIIVLVLINYVFVMYIMLIPMILSLIIGSIGGLNQTSLKKLMAYSSINSLGWISMSMEVSFNLWMFYFLTYSFIILGLMLIFNSVGVNYVNQLFFNTFSSFNKLFFSVLFFSLGGLPPFLGFLPKLLVLQYLLLGGSILICIILCASSLVNLFFYIRVISIVCLINHIKLKWQSLLNFELSLLFMFGILNLGGVSLVMLVKHLY